MRTALLAAICFAALTQSSWAYLNPGTSSLLLQGVAASLAVVMGFVTLGWQRIKLFFLKLTGKSPRKPTPPPADDDQSS